jgi:hypothetical protein
MHHLLQWIRPSQCFRTRCNVAGSNGSTITQPSNHSWTKTAQLPSLRLDLTAALLDPMMTQLDPTQWTFISTVWKHGMRQEQA